MFDIEDSMKDTVHLYFLQLWQNNNSFEARILCIYLIRTSLDALLPPNITFSGGIFFSVSDIAKEPKGRVAQGYSFPRANSQRVK